MVEVFNCTPPELREAALQNGVQNATENVLLAYYQKMSKTKKSATMWTSYSMLRACLCVNRNVDISKFVRLQAFLKRQAEGYEPKKSKILQPEQIEQFLVVANDLFYLASKVILIMGYAGACRQDELTRMSIHDIKVKDDSIEVNGPCTKSPIGINKIGQEPKMIASYLQLPNPEQYTGHCFRRSSASHLANSEGDLITIKQHGGWKSSTVAEGYIESSLKKKNEVAEMLKTKSAQLKTSTFDEASTSTVYFEPVDVPQTNISGNTNFEQNIEMEEDEKPPPDELDGQRVHAWVLLLAGERDVENSVFIEPSTGIVYPLDSPLYLGIESVWNHQNYWVNMQECTEGPGCLKYDLTDVKNWEHLLIGEPIKWRRRKTDESEMEEDSNLEMYDEKHLDIPMSWSMKISIPHDVLKSRFPNGMKRTKYKRTLVEEYAPYVQYDGMVLRIVRYSDFDCTEEQSVEERFENRRDKLMKVMNDIQTGMATEYFDGGREDGVRKHVYYRDNTPDSDKDRIIEFNHQARYDALSKLEISPEDTSEHYLGTDHSLYYRYILYAERKPSGYGIRRNIVRIMEKFNRNEEKLVSEDIAWREFAIADREISLKFHYGKGKVTASTREYSKPPLAEMGEGMKFYPELTSGYQAEIGRKPPRQLELFFLLEDQLKEEEKSINHVRNNETMIADFLLQRDREMAFPKLDVSLFNIEQNVEFRKGMLERENEKILQKEREVDEEIDYLKPYFARLGSPAELKYNDAVQLRDSCLKEFRELMLNRATKIQRQFEVTSEDLGRRQQWYIINHEDLSADEEAQYFEEVNQIIFLLHIYEIRLLRHRSLSSFRYAALVNYLKHHPLLEKLL